MAEDSECHDTPRAVSVLLIHGTEDPLVPYGGGQVGLGNQRDRGGAQSVAATRDYWLRADGLQNEQPVRLPVPAHGRHARQDQRQQADLGQGRRTAGRGADHRQGRPRRTQPEATTTRRCTALIVGAQNHDLEAVEEAWSFFRNKRAP